MLNIFHHSRVPWTLFTPRHCMLQKPPFLQKLFLWVTPKPVYIFRRCIASCTVIIMLTALSAPSHILDSYTHQKKQTMNRHGKNRAHESDMVGFSSIPPQCEFVLTCGGLFYLLPENQQWKTSQGRQMINADLVFFFYGFPFLVYGFGQRSNLPWVYSVCWRMESHKQQKLRRKEWV